MTSHHKTNDASVVAEYCKKHLDLANPSLSSEYGYSCVPLCVIDAIYSINARYTSTENAVLRFCKYFQVPRYATDSTDELSVSRFVTFYEDLGVDGMARQVYQNRQRTSTRNGILKAEAILHFSYSLVRFNVEYLKDVERILENNDFESEVKSIRGQGSGLSLRYFYMLAGSEDFVKPDRMVNRFIEQAIGMTLGSDETTDLLVDTCQLLSEEYPNLTPRTLDNLIWQYQRDENPRQSMVRC